MAKKLQNITAKPRDTELFYSATFNQPHAICSLHLHLQRIKLTGIVDQQTRNLTVKYVTSNVYIVDSKTVKDTDNPVSISGGLLTWFFVVVQSVRPWGRGGITNLGGTLPLGSPLMGLEREGIKNSLLVVGRKIPKQQY